MTTADFTAAFDAGGIQYRIESDGAIVTDCPVCELENKGAGKAKIFPDGNQVCFRFNGSGEHPAHRRQMLDAWNLSPRAAHDKPKAFISETILDGSLTLEIERGERNKQTVTARNCSSVLHLDHFALCDATARTKFVKNLNLPETDALVCAQTLIQLADRFARVVKSIPEKEETEAKPVSFVVLSDGRRAELTTRGFAVYDPSNQTTTYETRLVDDDGSVYVPLLTAEQANDIGLYLPSGVEEYGTEKELDDAIFNYAAKYVDIRRQQMAISSKYVRLSYLIEHLQEVPYLRAAGQSGTGKSRFAFTFGLICYRPIFSIGMTAPVLFRIMSLYNPTIIFDEFNLDTSSEDTEFLVQTLNAGISRNAKVHRLKKFFGEGDGADFRPEGFSPFGCKILSGLKLTNSAAFESRTYPIFLEETSRDDIPLQILPEMYEEAQSVRNKLTLYKLRFQPDQFNKRLRESEQALKDAGNIRKRLIQISTPLYALIESGEVKANFIAELQERTKDVQSERSQSLEGQIVQIIHSRLFVDDENGEWKFVEYDSDLVAGKEGKADERLTTKSITEEINASLPDKRKHSPEYVGKTITNSLHLKTEYIKRRKSANFQKRAIRFDNARLSTLFKIFNLHIPDFFTTLTTNSVVNSNNATDKVSVDNETTDTESGYLHSTEILQSQDLTGASVASVDNSGRDREAEIEATVDETAVIELPDYMQNCIALDTETEPFDEKLGITPQNAKALGISLCYDGETADYVTDSAAWSFCLPDEDKTVIFHNAKFDFGVLERAALPLPSVWEDTFIAACLLDESSEHGLKPLAKKHLCIEEPDTFEDVNRFRLIDPERFENYAKNDARFTFRLWQLFKPEIDRQNLGELYELEKQIVPVVRDMERRGMQLDAPALKELDSFIKSESERLTAAIYEEAATEFDLHSPQQTAVVLYDKLGLDCPKETPTGNRSVDAETLKELEGEHPIVSLLLEHRQMDKLASTFTTQLLKMRDADDRTKAEFNQLGAKSGRFTCRRPNLQQVPSRSELGKRLRSCFIAPPGKKLCVADFSQMELRVLAHYSQDAVLLKAFEENADLHTVAAQKIFKKSEVSKDERAIAKMINFGIAYGISSIGL